MNGVSIQILMNRFFDLVTGNNLKRWIQQDNLLGLQVVQATTQTPAEAERKLLVQLRAENHAKS